MKNLLKNWIGALAAAVVVGASTTGWAAINFTGGGGNFTAVSTGAEAIPDFPTAGPSHTLNFNFSDYSQLADIKVTFTTSGGWNGDLYAYLSHGSGLAILLNKVGANGGDPDGYSTSGFNSITLGMTTAPGGDIHLVQFPTSAGGPYEADGRLVHTDTTRDNRLSVFNGVNPNGNWTLYFEDTSPGSTATLSSWSVNISAVPEPVTWALIVFGVGFVVVQGVQLCRRRLAVAG